MIYVQVNYLIVYKWFWMLYFFYFIFLEQISRSVWSHDR